MPRFRPRPPRYLEEAERLFALAAKKAKERGFSIRMLEDRLQIPRNVLSRILNGKRHGRLSDLLMVCDAIGLNWGDFFAQAYGERTADGEIPAPRLAVTDQELERQFLAFAVAHKLLPASTDEEDSPSKKSG